MRRVFRVGAAALAAAACSELPGSVDDVDTVSLSVSDTVLVLGDTARLSARVLDRGGNRISAPQLHWSSNDLLMVQVDSGRIVTVGAGTTTVTAESRGVSASATITVRMDLTVVAAGGGHTCGVTQRGRVACWGTNASGQIGNGTVFSGPTPMLVVGATEVVDVVAGGAHTCALTAARTVWCWGQNVSGQLGIGRADGSRHDVFEPIAGSIRFASLTAGNRHTCGLTLDGTAYCWGGGFYGQLGSGTPQAVCPALDEPCNLEPVPVSGGLKFARLSAREEHTCGITLAGEPYCWGWNASGQLGDSTLQNRSTPTPVRGALTFSDITAGLLHSCGLDASGRAYCWGSNLVGRLGVSDTLTSSFVPIAVSGALRFTAIASGEEHTCAIAEDSSVWCWGFNGRGALGASGVLRADQPVRAEAPQFATITTGNAHTCGRAVNELVYCWGQNSVGQLGTVGLSRTRAVPVNGQ